ncbi:MAG TPA: SET domain-containing protein-lysine N-methyltransferase [Candidatus Limnocylindria bacterium]|nr:SET domain-containing protein-lysine N-methyltransferase [Candidatus Limnocylindria bacterium]
MRRKQAPVLTINSLFCCYRLRIRRSPIHRFGVFATEQIPGGRKVMEYTGQLMSSRALIQRAGEKSQVKCRKLICLARLDDYWVLDGASGGSGAEFISHSCDPNLKLRWLAGHLLFFSRRAIRKGQELTADYRFSNKTEPVSCHCGSPNCRGTINVH